MWSSIKLSITDWRDSSVTSTYAKSEEYKAETLKTIIEDFGVAFTKHFYEEIDSLLSLIKFDLDGSKIKKCYLNQDKKVQNECSVVSRPEGFLRVESLDLAMPAYAAR